MKPRILVFWADGMEEIEGVTPVDILRRAGLEVMTVGLESQTIQGARGIVLQTDCLISEAPTKADALVFPGGQRGAENLAQSADVRERILAQHESRKWIAAICASPALVLAPLGILNGRKVTCYPGFEEGFNAETVFSRERVVKDGHILTSRGPGTAFAFSLAIARELVGEKTEQEVGQGTLFL